MSVCSFSGGELFSLRRETGLRRITATNSSPNADLHLMSSSPPFAEWGATSWRLGARINRRENGSIMKIKRFIFDLRRYLPGFN